MRIVCTALYSAMVLSATASAQQRGPEIHEIPNEATCRECSITLHPVVTLGRMEDEASIMPSSRLAMDGSGRYLVAPTAATGEIAVFDGNGVFDRTIGRQGSGPGEFESRIRYVEVTPGDSLVVLEAMKLTMLTPSGEYVRSGQLPDFVQGFRFLMLDDGRVLVNNYRTQNPALCLLDQEFNEVRLFGRTALGRMTGSDSLQYVLASRRGEIVVAQMNYGYALEVWDTTGAIKHRISRAVEWFPAWEPEPPQPERPVQSARPAPKPRIAGLHVDGQGRLWVLASIPDPNWDQGSRDLDRWYDTVIDVIDVQSWQLYASERFDAALSVVSSTGFLYDWREENSGLLRFAVWRPEIVGRTN